VETEKARNPSTSGTGRRRGGFQMLKSLEELSEKQEEGVRIHLPSERRVGVNPRSGRG